ncbi:MAG: amino acid carrier protein, partial [Haliea sp.]|nr:amino acid carrier protein [Haliea sp.]
MQALSEFFNTINSWAWGPVMLVLLLGTGLYLSIGLRFLTLRSIPRAFRLLFVGRQGQGQGDISPFNALMTSLSATIGTGNIAGVATALVLGGPGALFWMWITALVGMATKYAEAVCAVRFREQDAAGNYSGGPMYYIRNGLHKRWHWLAWAFAIFGTLAGFGIANTVQSNSVAQVLEDFLAVPPLVTGLVLMVLVAAVILGGVRRIAHVASWLVPMMALGYTVMGAVVIVTHITAVPAAIATIVEAAFSGAAAAGGFAGATVWAAIRFGVARGIFSNEAGLGSAPIAHAAAQTN